MDKFTQWFKNLRKDGNRFSPVAYHTKELKNPLAIDQEWNERYHTKAREAAYPVEIAALNKAILKALTERKTPTRADFEAQLETVLEANRALEHQRLLGVSANSEMSKILANNFYEQLSKLRFLVYEEIDIPPEVAAEKVREYMEGIEK